MQAFSKVHYTHLILYYQASLANDPNKAKSIAELSQLLSDFCSQKTAEFGLKNCQKKKKGPSSKLVQRIGPKTTLLQSLSFVFYLPWEACESCAPTLTPKLQIPVLQVPTDSQAQQKEAVSLRGEVCFRSGGLLHRADGTSMG